MRKIFAFGESLIDIIRKNDLVIARKSGGAMLNSLVSLGRLNLDPYLISEFGNDEYGDEIAEFLKVNGVDIRYVYRFTNGNTAVANAELDLLNNANYSFKKRYPSQRFRIKLPDFRERDFLLFGSFYSLENEVRPYLNKLMESAAKQNALLFYDPNIRSNKKVDHAQILDFINANFEVTDIIRASNEDCYNIFKAACFNEACKSISGLDSKVFIYTAASKGIYLKTPQFIEFYEIPDLDVISSIGAGDSFNAGIIYGLIQKGVTKNNFLSLEKQIWDQIIRMAISFASDVCQSLDNYISIDFAKKLLAK